MDFTDKTVLVTGGGAGIGLAAAQAFLEQGARVALIEIDEQRAEQARELLNKPGTEMLVVQGDATDAGIVRELAAQVEQRFGVLDVLVNNVGDFLRIAKPFELYADDEIASLYAANLGHVFTVTRAMLPLLRRSAAGSIVTVSSIEAFRGIPYCSVYGAFKAAITGFTQSLALELAPAGIRVNLIAPRPPKRRRFRCRRWSRRNTSTISRAGFRWAASARRATLPTASCSWPARARPGSPARRCMSMAARWPRPAGIATSRARGPTCRSSPATA